MDLSNLNPQFLYDLNSRITLDGGQSKLAQAIFRDKVRLAAWQAGRKRGKTTTLAYVIVRAANTIPNGAFYWFGPVAKQMREIVWESGRLQNFVPKKYVKRIKDQEMRITYWNGSFIKVDGSDVRDISRGFEADGAVYDEGKDFSPRFDLEFRPNLGPRKGWLVMAGTPPYNDVTPSEKQFFRIIEEAKFRKDGYFSTAPSWDRPDPEWQKEMAEIRALYEFRSKTDPRAW